MEVIDSVAKGFIEESIENKFSLTKRRARGVGKKIEFQDSTSGCSKSIIPSILQGSSCALRAPVLKIK